MNRPGEAVVHFQRAAELQMQTPIEALLSLGEMATCKILTRELIFSLLLLVIKWLLQEAVYVMHYTLYNKSQGDTVQANKKQWYLKAKYTLNKYMDVLFYRAFFSYWKGIKTLRCPVFVAQFLQLKFSMLWLFLFVCLQVTMMVLCQCSQRCSWCAKREDYSYQAPPLLSVRFNFNLPAYVLLVCRPNPVKC